MEGTGEPIPAGSQRQAEKWPRVWKKGAVASILASGGPSLSLDAGRVSLLQERAHGRPHWSRPSSLPLLGVGMPVVFPGGLLRVGPLPKVAGEVDMNTVGFCLGPTRTGPHACSSLSQRGHPAVDSPPLVPWPWATLARGAGPSLLTCPSYNNEVPGWESSSGSLRKA